MSTARHRPHRRVWGAAVLAGLLVAALLWPLRPQPPVLGSQTRGDAALAAEVRDLLEVERGVGGVAVALVDAEGVRSAALGRADGVRALGTDTPMEIGSVGKALTGLLLADLDAAGAVSADLPAAEALGAEDAGLGRVTLEDLATHQSGLPRLPLSGLLSGLGASIAGSNPYAGWDGARVLEAATGRALDGPAAFSYSNLGAATLGAALGAAATTTYPDLLHERVLQPVGMHDTVVATDARELPRHRAEGITAAGARAAPWLGPGYAGAGLGHWSTVEDLAHLLRALLDGEAPGAHALVARRPVGDGASTGLGWLHRSQDGVDVVWHNGATGGFRSFLALDLEARKGVAVLARTDLSIDYLGLRLLGVHDAAPAGRPLGVPVTVALLVSVAAGVLGVARGGSGRRPLDRIDVVTATTSTALALFLLRQLGSWDSVPPGAWSLAVAVAGTVVAAGAMLWQRLPAASGKRPRQHWVRGGVSTSVSLGLLTVLLFA